MKALKKDPIIKKGTVIGHDWFYVVVEVRLSGHVNCICDNANNVYSFDLNEIKTATFPHEWLILQPEELEERYDLFANLDESYNSLIDRKLPFDVIVEVLTGYHDHRFQSD